MPNAGLQSPPPGARGVGPFAVGSAAFPRRFAVAAAWAALAVLILLILLPAPGRAIELDLSFAGENLVPPEDLVGEWAAVVEIRDNPQPVTLRIDQVTPGKTAGKLSYSSPRRCFVDLEYGGPHEGRHIFYMIRFTNCFEYQSSDFVALSRDPGEETDREAAAAAAAKARKRKKQQDLLAKFDLGQAERRGAEPDGESPAGAKPRKKAQRIFYTVSLGGEEHESAIMVRQ
jgi:hypothetical protein